MRFGYTLMSEEHGPRELVEIARRAEEVGFEFVVQSDHFHPWVPEQEHSPNCWTTLGAVAQATSTIGLRTFVTCPILRYHPAIVAQQAATLACLSENRFTLSVGAGERLNEHVVGLGWPAAEERHEMLGEALEIIRALWQGGYQSYRGEHFALEDARLFDLPEQPIPLAMAISGPESLQVALAHADELVATEPLPELIDAFRREKGAGAAATTQVPVAWAADAAAGLEVAHRMFRWSALGWKVQAELPNPVNFAAAAQHVRPEDLAEQIPHGPDVAAYVAAVQKMADGGFDHLAFVQIGPDQDGFLRFWSEELRPALADL